MKKIIPRLVCLVMVLCTFPVAAAEESLKEDIFTYSVSGNTAVVTNVDDTQKLVEVPQTLGGYTVTAIRDGAFGGITVIEEDICLLHFFKQFILPQFIGQLFPQGLQLIPRITAFPILYQMFILT